MKFAQVAIALGSNQGPSEFILESAIENLDKTPGMTLKYRSSWYRTAPVGPPQPDYLNGCVVLHVQMMAQQVLETLLAIETKFGRTREEHWGPRTLDLDLLLFDNLIVETRSLQLPHPRMRERAFVLVPLAEIAPDWVEPVTGVAIADLAKAIDCTGILKL